jgi:hypothetical protein
MASTIASTVTASWTASEVTAAARWTNESRFGLAVLV